MANIIYHPGLEEDFLGGDSSFATLAHLQPSDDASAFNTTELNAPEYSTDEFRMFHFKVARCSKRFVHDWRSCPFAHPTENARRRDPRTTRYLPVPCPDYKRGICLRGDSCPYSHGVYECWLHPAKYRTQLCKEGPHCRRPVCFFAHTVQDLRQPTHVWDGNMNDITGVANPQQQPSVASMLLQNGSGSSSAINNSNHGSGSGSGDEPTCGSSTSRSESDASRRLLAAEEAMNNFNQDGRTSSDSNMNHHQLHGTNNGSSIGGGWTGVVRTHVNNNNNSGSTLSAVTSPSATPTTTATPTEDNSLALAATAQPRQQQQPGTLSHVGGADDDHLLDGLSLSSSVTGVGQRSASTELSAGHAVSATSDVATEDFHPRLSLDSNLQPQEQADQDEDQQKSGNQNWSQSLAASAAAAAAMSGIPVNEQPILHNHGPRMSNAVARKLGLAPTKPAGPDPRVRNRSNNGIASPERLSLDGTSSNSSLPSSVHHQHNGMNGSRTSFDRAPPPSVVSIPPGNGAGQGGAPGSPLAVPYGTAATGNAFGAAVPGINPVNVYSSSYPGAMVSAGPPAAASIAGNGDPLSIHPALLNLVAANVGHQQPFNAVPHHHHHHQQQQQQQHYQIKQQLASGMSINEIAASLAASNGTGLPHPTLPAGMPGHSPMMPGDPGSNAPSVAKLIQSMSQWSMGGDGLIMGVPPSEDHHHHLQHQSGGGGVKMDGSMQQPQQGGSGTSYHLPLDLDVFNNQAGQTNL